MNIKKILISSFSFITLISCTPEEQIPLFNPMGKFISFTANDGKELRLFVAGPENSNTAVLIVHDWFGISDFTKESVERLGALGYRTAAVDLYMGSSALTHEEAARLMNDLDRNEIDEILQSGLNFLKKPERRIATLGFSMGGLESLMASLNDPESVSGTVMIYGGDFDKIDDELLGKIQSPVLCITGAEDNWSLPASIEFLNKMKNLEKLCEIYIYPGASHAYSQPLFNDGKNFDSEATRMTWLLTEDFLERNLKD